VEAHKIFKSIGALEGANHTMVVILEYAFSGATLLVVLSYVLHDLVVSVYRHWKGGLREPA
jgi:hypothetical protein